MSDIQALLGRMVREMGDVAPEWRAIFARVPRHMFVPRIVGCSPADASGAKEGFVLDATSDRQRWLELVYSDRVLMVVNEEDPERFSSSSRPSVMARFLHLLDVKDDCTVLEIGTGTGYNAALLCERLGSERVTSTDIDAELVDAARVALLGCGYAATLAAVDGYQGYPPRAPYDRIIATCAVPHIPTPWIDQLESAGVLVAPLLNGMLVGLRRQQNGCLVGHADPMGADFMSLRSPFWPAEPTWAPFADAIERGTIDQPEGWMRGTFPRFFARLQVPDLEMAFTDNEWNLASRLDGSWARIACDENGGCMLTDGGARRLWMLYERAVLGWDSLGRPEWDRFGLTVRPDGGQYVWLDSPASEHRWELG